MTRAIGVEPVGAAVERQGGIMVAHLAVEAGEIAASQYRAGWRRRGRSGRRAPRPSRRRGKRRGRRRRWRRIGAGLRAAASARSMPMPKASGIRGAARRGWRRCRCRDRGSAAPRPRSGQRRERRLDHHLGVGARRQRRGRQPEAPSPQNSRLPRMRSTGSPASRRASTLSTMASSAAVTTAIRQHEGAWRRAPSAGDRASGHRGRASAGLPRRGAGPQDAEARQMWAKATSGRGVPAGGVPGGERRRPLKRFQDSVQFGSGAATASANRPGTAGRSVTLTIAPLAST